MIRPLSVLSVGLSIAMSMAMLMSTAMGQLSGPPSPLQPSPQLSQKAGDAAVIAEKAQQAGHVRIIVTFSPPVAAADIRPDASNVDDVKAKVAGVQDALIARHFGSAADPAPGTGFARGISRFSLTSGFAVNVSQPELETLAADPDILTIQEDRLSPPTLLQSVPLIGMAAAYNAGATGAGQAVAILDTGVQATHEFLAGKVVAQACFSNSGGGGGGTSLCPNGTGTDLTANAANPNTPACLNGGTTLCEHGTNVAGIAAGATTLARQGEPPNGVAKNAAIVAVQVFTRFNTAAACSSTPPCISSYSSDEINALDLIFQNLTIGGKRIAAVNMSLGGGAFSGACDNDPLKPSIDRLRGAGVLTVVASGNEGSRTTISSPGCISSALTVGATDKADNVASYSNMSSGVDVLAPGGEGTGPCAYGGNNAWILGPIADPASNNTLACLVGTSMATPHVAGAVAAIRSACPNATADQIESALISTGKLVGDGRSGGVQTKPRVRVDLADSQACNPTAGTAIILPAILPYTRSGMIGTAVTAFGVILNAGTAAATACHLELPAGIPATFAYQTVDRNNQLTGTRNTPIDIPANGQQGFVFAITATQAINSLEIPIVFTCANTGPAQSINGVNTFIMSASATPTPDLIAQGLTPTLDSVVHIPGPSGTEIIAAATLDIGAAGTVNITIDDMGHNLPLSTKMCVTDSSGCITGLADGIRATFTPNTQLTFTVFVTAHGNIPFDPANSRLYIRLTDDSGVTRGATAVAVRTN